MCIRMVEPELPAIVFISLLLQQQPGARVMELAVVEDDEAGIPEEGRPQVVMTGRISKLVNDEIVLLSAILPDEVVCGEEATSGIWCDEIGGRAVDEDVDVMKSRDAGQQVAAVLGDAGFDGRKGCKPCQSQHASHTRV